MVNIAVISGSGDFPLKIIEKLKSLGEDFDVVSVVHDGLDGYPVFGLGEVGRMLDHIKSIGASKIIFCGSVKRPSFFSLKLDKVGREWLRCLGIRAFLGDDALLKGIRKMLQKNGLEIISPQSIMDTLLTPEGLLTKNRPKDADMMDVARGIYVLNVMSKADVGQALVVQEGVVLGMEAFEGTKKLIQRCKELKLSDEGGVLIKTAKINQEMSVDLPTIGKDTVLDVFESKLSGIALGSGKTQIIDFEETVKLADEKGIFIMGV